MGSLLGMVKSSSLESLHNVFKNAIKLDGDDGKHRARGASFSVSSPTGGLYFKHCCLWILISMEAVKLMACGRINVGILWGCCW